MKVSRFEPHILAPLADNNDLDVFMKELEEESQHVKASTASSASDASEDEGGSAQEVKKGVMRFVEALSRQADQRGRRRTHDRSRKKMAMLRYETQKSFDFNNFTQYSKKY